MVLFFVIVAFLLCLVFIWCKNPLCYSPLYERCLINKVWFALIYTLPVSVYSLSDPSMCWPQLVSSFSHSLVLFLVCFQSTFEYVHLLYLLVWVWVNFQPPSDTIFFNAVVSVSKLKWCFALEMINFLQINKKNLVLQTNKRTNGYQIYFFI